MGWNRGKEDQGSFKGRLGEAMKDYEEALLTDALGVAIQESKNNIRLKRIILIQCLTNLILAGVIWWIGI